MSGAAALLGISKTEHVHYLSNSIIFTYMDRGRTELGRTGTAALALFGRQGAWCCQVELACSLPPLRGVVPNEFYGCLNELILVFVPLERQKESLSQRCRHPGLIPPRSRVRSCPLPLPPAPCLSCRSGCPIACQAGTPKTAFNLSLTHRFSWFE